MQDGTDEHVGVTIVFPACPTVGIVHIQTPM